MKQMTGRTAGGRFFVALAVSATAIAGCVTGAQANPTVEAQSESERAGSKGLEVNAAESRAIAEGQRIAQSKCAACHAIDPISVSPDPGAPALREFVFLNDANRVAYRLTDGIRLGHDKMPLFDLEFNARESLVAYIKSIGD